MKMTRDCLKDRNKKEKILARLDYEFGRTVKW